MDTNKIYQRNVLELPWPIEDNSIDCCVTSPPYWGLRDYNNQEQIGLEKTPEEYVQKLVSVFNEVHRVLKPAGSLWLNLGDSYAHNGAAYHNGKSTLIGRKQGEEMGQAKRFVKQGAGLKPKDLVGIPWMVAFALRSAGWYLRQDIIWNKPNPMPESVTDRCTKAHEYIFLLSKSANYFYDHEIIKEACKNPEDDARRIAAQTDKNKNTPDHLRNGIRPRSKFGNRDGNLNGLHSGNDYFNLEKANKRSVWTVPTIPFAEAHFATYPEKLITPCILSGCPKDGIVLDPFFGAGTTGLVALSHGRKFIGMELNTEYIAIANKRLKQKFGMFYTVTP